MNLWWWDYLWWWDFWENDGKNLQMVCRLTLICLWWIGVPKQGLCVLSHSVMSDSLWPHGLQPARLLCPQNSLEKHIGVGCHFLLQGLFLTQGTNLGLTHCGQILYHLSHQGSPGRFIPRYFIIFGVMVNRIISLISLSDICC